MKLKEFNQRVRRSHSKLCNAIRPLKGKTSWSCMALRYVGIFHGDYRRTEYYKLYPEFEDMSTDVYSNPLNKDLRHKNG